MLKIGSILIFILFAVSLLCAQSLEVEGPVKITSMEEDGSVSNVVVCKEDGTLAFRSLESMHEYQVLSRSNDTLFLSNGGFAVLPPDQVDDADADPTNELQELSTNGDTIFIGNTNYIVLPGLQYLSTLIPVLPVQERLDNGESPIAIYNSGIPLDSLYGKMYEGGYIFFVDTQDTIENVEGMVAATQDIQFFQNTFFSWGCTETDPLPIVVTFPPSGPTAEINDGSSNTSIIVADNCSNSNHAAVKCNELTAGGKNDWFLPSYKELKLMWQNLDTNNFGNFENGHYWSSTAGDDGGAWYLDFSDGSTGNGLRSEGKYVRAARVF